MEVTCNWTRQHLSNCTLKINSIIGIFKKTSSAPTTRAWLKSIAIEQGLGLIPEIKMIEENQQDIERASTDDFKKLLEIHKQLKEAEKEITDQLGTVIIK